MENAVVSRQPNEAETPDARKFPIMRTLATLHECDVETLFSSVDTRELDIHDLLDEMVSKREVEASGVGSRRERFALTLKGWAEYMNLLGSIYEFPE